MANAYRDQNNVPTLIGVSNVDGQTPVRLYVDPVTHRLLVDSNGGGGGGFTELPATGVVDGSNANFTFTQVPSYIVSDGAWYKPLDNNSNVQWSSVGLTVTMTIPPQSAIFGIA